MWSSKLNSLANRVMCLLLINLESIFSSTSISTLRVVIFYLSRSNTFQTHHSIPFNRSPSKFSTLIISTNGTMAESPQFKLQMHTQPQSNLMQVAAEIRLKILRYLLVSESVIENQAGMEHPDLYDERVQLSAQVLRVCQTLHREASDVLYQENSLGIDFMLLVDPRYTLLTGRVMFRNVSQLSILNSNMKIHTRLKQLLSVQQDMRVEQTVGSDPRSSIWSSAVYRFGTYYIRLQYANIEQAIIACFFLRSWVCNKYVTLQLEFMEDRRAICNPVMTDIQSVVSILKLLEVKQLRYNFLRCTSAACSHSRLDSNCCFVRSPDIHVQQDVARADNCFEDWIDFHQKILDALPRISNTSFAERYDNLVDQLQHCALNYECEAFQKTRCELLEAAMEWNKEWKREEQATLSLRYRAAEDYVLESEKALTAAMYDKDSETRLQRPSSLADLVWF